MQLQFPVSTGQVASSLGVSEPRLNDLVRRGKVCPAPRVVAGRRLWEEPHVRQAARALGVSDEHLQREGGAR